MAAFPFYPLFPTHFPRLVGNCRAVELSPRSCVTSLPLPHCHLRSCQGSCPPGGLEVESPGSPQRRPRYPVLLLYQVRATLQESPTACWSEPVPRRATVSHLSFHSLFSWALRPQKGFLKPLVISEFMRKETHAVKPNRTNWPLHFIMRFWELIKLWKKSESKYLAG